MATLDEIKKEYEQILKQLAEPGLISDSPACNASRSDAGREKFEELNKRRNRLEKIINKEKELQDLKNRAEDNQLIISSREEPELTALAETELSQLSGQQTKLEEEIKKLLENKPACNASRSDAGRDKKAKEEPQALPNPALSEEKAGLGGQAVIMEIRAGAGGQESALFAADLYRMYSKYAQTQEWKQKVLDSSSTEIGGFKEIIFELRGNGVFSKLKYEGGVHRVQRIPTTEKTGRIHTSTASVAVLPKPQKTQLHIKSDDLKMEFYKSSGPGGQNVNKRETAVRIIHLPTGIVASSQTERNQLQNKENALSILSARLHKMEEEKSAKETQGKRKAQIHAAKRAEKIRTYNFPQDRLTDHRIKKSWHNIEKILNGELESVIKAIQSSVES